MIDDVAIRYLRELNVRLHHLVSSKQRHREQQQHLGSNAGLLSLLCSCGPVAMRFRASSALLLSLFFMHCCSSTQSLKPDSALTVVENPDGGGEAEVIEEEATVDEDEEVVQPTGEWQTLRPGQAVPAGSHVRLNLQTGQREVRLGAEQLKLWTQEHRESEDLRTSFSPEELKRAIKNIKEDLNSGIIEQQDSLASDYRPLEELKRDMAQLDLLVETDVQIMRRLLEQLKSSNCTTEQRLSILLELEYMVHQVDNAQTLCSMGGLQLILQSLNSSDPRLQESSAFVLGSALSSNPVVQVKAVESGALQMLLTILVTTQPLLVKKKVLFAVASILRHFPYAQHHFLSHGGLQVLTELFRADGGGVLRARIVTMLYDMISEKEMITQAGVDLDASHEERLHQYSQLFLEEELLEMGWCSLVPQLLESTEHDYREKALRTLLAMAPVCSRQFRSDHSLLGSLLSLRNQYQKIVHSEMTPGEGNDYFVEIVELIEALQVKMK